MDYRPSGALVNLSEKSRRQPFSVRPNRTCPESRRIMVAATLKLQVEMKSPDKQGPYGEHLQAGSKTVSMRIPTRTRRNAQVLIVLKLLN